MPDEDTNPLVDVLLLAGAARVERGRLRVRNRIYARVFDREWVVQHMPDAELRRQREAFRRGVARTAAVASVMLGIVGGLAGFALQQKRLSDDRLSRSYVATGMRLVDDGDLLGALPWLAAALRLERGDRVRAAVHQLRLSSVLRQSPRLVQLCFHDGPVTDVAFSPDERRILTASADGTARRGARPGPRCCGPPEPSRLHAEAALRLP